MKNTTHTQDTLRDLPVLVLDDAGTPLTLDAVRALTTEDDDARPTLPMPVLSGTFASLDEPRRASASAASVHGPTVSGRFVGRYSGRGGFPSGPYYDVILVDASDTEVGKTRARALTKSEAKNAARRLAKRLGYTLGTVR